MKKSNSVVVALTLFGMIGVGSDAGAVVRPDFLFQSNMVLGRGRETVFTGSAEAGETVSVRLRGKTYSAKAGADGRYAVSVESLPVVKDPFDVVISDGKSSVTLTNVVSGLVILAAGQSNMEVPVKETLNPEEEAAAANYPLIREFKVEHDFNFKVQTTMKGKWTPVCPQTAPEIGAIGYYTARMVQRELGGIPVGIVNNSYSGTSIQPWLPLEILREKYKGSLGSYDKYSPLGRDGVIRRREELGRSFLHQDAKNEGEEKGWHQGAQADWVDVKMPNWLDYLVYGEDSDGAFWVAREFDLDPAFAAKDLEFRATAIDDYDVTYLNGVKIGATGEETPDSYDKPRAYRIPKGLAKPGKNVISIRIFDTAHAGGMPPDGKVSLACGEEELSLAGTWKTKAEKILKAKAWPPDYLPLQKIYHAGSVLYNAMFAPLKGMKADAILWYQGESNAGDPNYGSMFKDLIVRWRKDLASEDAPFVFVQLAAFQGRPKGAADTGSWPLTRAEQEKALALPNVRMVPTIDIGDAHRIHPLNKQEVGRRTALVLLQDFWAKDRFKGVVDYPAVTKVVREGNAFVVSFKGAKGLRTTDGRAPQGFSVVGPADRRTRKAPAAWAKARIDGERVVVEIPPEIAEPVRLRYAWHMNPDVNTVNGLGFPMLPFEKTPDCSPAASASAWTPAEWPVLKTYDGAHLRRIALPVGGIGTGTISLGGRGELTDWQLTNVPAIGYQPAEYGADAPSFVLWVKDGKGAKSVRALEGPMASDEYLDGEGRPFGHRGFPRFDAATFAAAYPFGQVLLTDGALPVRVRVKAFNPFVPGDSAASSLPVMALAYEVENLTDRPVEAAVCGKLRNFIGCDAIPTNVSWRGESAVYKGFSGTNAVFAVNGLKGVKMLPKDVDSCATGWGTFALTTDDGEGVSARTSFGRSPWYRPTVEMMDDFGSDGRLDLPSPEPGRERNPMLALAVKKTVPAKGKAVFPFYLTWSFPNRRAWQQDDRHFVGNHYTLCYRDAEQAAVEIVPRLATLERRTLSFVNAFLSSSAPVELKEAALFNLAVLRSPTVFRLPSGHLMGWEGVIDHLGFCEGTCTHVWNYEQATAFLFPDLARTMRDVEFNYATGVDGGMSFRAELPLFRANVNPGRAADGQMGTIVKAYREWKLSGDRAFLDSVWPNVKKALAFAWTAEKNAWDADRDGVMEGPQGNTMDVDYWGPNPQMAFWYLAALKAGAAMAREEGDAAFASECERLCAKGRAAFDKVSFNGEYFEQRIPEAKKDVGFQLGEGCLVDQLVGQTVARLVGLGELGDAAHARAAIASVAKYNYVPDLGKWFNPLRAYGLAGEAGLVMASWPHGFHKNPFPYYSEVMTGFEYVAASEMYYQGLDDLALRTVRDVRARHDGAKRNPFSEPEAGHHYARSMASWGTYLAWSGFGWDATTGEMRFANRSGVHFFAVGPAWGVCTVGDDKVEIRCFEGSLPVRSVLVGGQPKSFSLSKRGGREKGE